MSPNAIVHVSCCAVQGRSLLSVLVANLLQLSEVPLLSSLSNDSDPVHTNLLAVSVSVYDEENQTRDILELHEAEGDGCSSSLVPVLGLQSDALRCRGILRLLESQIMRGVRVDLDSLGSHWDFVIVICGRWK